MSSIPLTAELFLSGAYEYTEEAFNMHNLLCDEDLIGGSSPNPALPHVVSLDMQNTFSELHMYTNNLRELAAPRELCVKKALELISSRSTYELNLEAFRMELLSEVLVEVGVDDVGALIQGIRRICDFLLANFDNYTQSNADFFPYEFYCLHNGRYLFLTKITFDANIPAIRPATIVQPAHAYPKMQARPRADYIAQTDQCIVL